MATKGESGLTGIALDPEYEKNRFVYVMYSVPQPGNDIPVEQRVVRLRDMGLQGVEPTTLLVLPATVNVFHNGGRLAFGPDSKLYVSVGDTERPTQVQDPRTLYGKILRFSADGTIPADNPTPRSPVFALGFLNVFMPFISWNWSYVPTFTKFPAFCSMDDTLNTNFSVPV